MPLRLRPCALLAALVLAAVPLAARQPAVTWPAGHRAAIVLTYDDALRSQLDHAVPQLDAAGFKGTFFLSGMFQQDDVERWRAVAKEGHELANHSVFHPCARGSFDMPEQYNNERYSVATMLTEIRVMNTMLHAIDGRETHTYATPCGQHVVGGVDYLPELRKAGLVPYVRGTGAPRPGPIDPFDVPGTFFPDTTTGADLIAFVEGIRDRGGLGVLGFHGVGGDYLTVSAEAHQALVQYLHDHRDVYWVTTFREAMDQVTAAGR
jgi:peptidoglycan/xylan/chitin deacetylase (PgdA/CDA1 family)